MRDMRNIVEQLGESKIAESDYFTESTYKNLMSNNEKIKGEL